MVFSGEVVLFVHFPNGGNLDNTKEGIGHPFVFCYKRSSNLYFSIRFAIVCSLDFLLRLIVFSCFVIETSINHSFVFVNIINSKTVKPVYHITTWFKTKRLRKSLPTNEPSETASSANNEANLTPHRRWILSRK
jgi:hypothetical protein